jgi:FkbM family methyltransferase
LDSRELPDTALRDSIIRHMTEPLQAPVARAAEAADPGMAAVFERFTPWRGKVPEGFRVNFVGVMTPVHWWPVAGDTASGAPTFPPLNEEYFEWIDLLEAVVSAEHSFTMLELGAGWGRWGVNAVAALRQVNNLPYSLVFVEAEPQRPHWLAEHLRNNHVDLSRSTIVEAAACGHDGFTTFQTCDDPARDWGTRIGGRNRVRAVSLATLLKPLAHVDLVDLDVQGAEYDVLSAAPDELHQKVKRVHVETHNTEVEIRLYLYFSRLGWLNLHFYPLNTETDTLYGRVSFQGGVQSWVNPSLCSQRDLTSFRQRATAAAPFSAVTFAEISERLLDKKTRRARGWKQLFSRLGL